MCWLKENRMSHDFCKSTTLICRCKAVEQARQRFAFAQAGDVALVSRSQEKLEAVVGTVLETGVASLSLRSS